ncbi:FAD-dependent oxidoreductase [Rhodococcus sp. T7]|uniref:FAD-dependent oxidoreductase n=1 Tax=Rhodococcus sp. T7 TaxID=627444 RepID=UPI001F1F8A5C|nr:FAD-dependent monooxygenase [Rhodococcus sp. T7]
MTPHGGGRLDVLVAGAGPTGLTLALSAHDHGARVCIVDRRPDECPHSRAFLVQPRTLEFSVRTASPRTLRRTPPRHGCTCTYAVGACPSRRTTSASGYRSPAVSPHTSGRSGTVPASGTAPAGSRSNGARTWHSIRAGDDVVGVGTRDGCPTRIGSRFLVGCDGTASTVRRAAGISWNGAAYPAEDLAGRHRTRRRPPPRSRAHAIHRPGVLFLLPLGDVAPWRMLTAQPPNRSPASGERRCV